MFGGMDTLVQQTEHLGILSVAPPDDVKAFVADIAPALGHIDVISTRTGLLHFDQASSDPLPPLGEVLVTEAHVLLDGQTEGYSAVLGRDVLQAVAVAVIDAALHHDLPSALVGRILDFIDAQAALLAQAEEPEVPQAQPFVA